MKIGMVSDSLGNLGFEAMLDAAAAMGVEGVEMNTGNWSAAPHLDLERLLSSETERQRFLKAFSDRNLEIVALNANGNQLHPVDGACQSKIVDDTVRLAGLLGVTTVSMMSGLPGGSPADQTPNWIVSSWPPETQSILAWQWEEKLRPYWRRLAETARANGVSKLCIELHGNQLVYNARSLLELRADVGPIVGANLDPSHLFWMGADPIAAVDALGDAIHHVHAKDTFINQAVCGTVSRLENGPMADVPARSWNYITLGHGHDERWWRTYCYRLRMNGYDGWLSIEHEDVVLSRLEGVRRSVDLLKLVMPVEASDYVP